MTTIKTMYFLNVHFVHFFFVLLEMTFIIVSLPLSKGPFRPMYMRSVWTKFKHQYDCYVGTRWRESCLRWVGGDGGGVPFTLNWRYLIFIIDCFSRVFYSVSRTHVKGPRAETRLITRTNWYRHQNLPTLLFCEITATAIKRR